MLNNRGLFLTKDHNLFFQNSPVGDLDRGEVLVKIRANGICGSDIHFYKEGVLGNFIVEEPYIPGHEASGEVADVGEGVFSFKPGDRVAIEPGIPCMKCTLCKTGRYNLCREVVFLSAPPIDGTLCEYVVMPEHFLHKVPDTMDFLVAALAEPLAVAVHGVNRANFKNGASGVIWGVGPIGLLILQAFKVSGGGRVVCVDISDERLALAREYGADVVINGSREEVPGEIGEVIFEASGSNVGARNLIRLASPGGICVQVGWPAGNFVNMDIAQFLDKELTYHGVNRYANAFETAIGWLADGRINTRGFISHIFDFEESEKAFQQASDNPKDTIKVMIVNK